MGFWRRGVYIIIHHQLLYIAILLESYAYICFFLWFYLVCFSIGILTEVDKVNGKLTAPLQEWPSAIPHGGDCTDGSVGCTQVWRDVVKSGVRGKNVKVRIHILRFFSGVKSLKTVKTGYFLWGGWYCSLKSPRSQGVSFSSTMVNSYLKLDYSVPIGVNTPLYIVRTKWNRFFFFGGEVMYWQREIDCATIMYV